MKKDTKLEQTTKVPLCHKPDAKTQELIDAGNLVWVLSCSGGISNGAGKGHHYVQEPTPTIGD